MNKNYRYEYIVNESNCRVSVILCIRLINYIPSGDNTRPRFHYLHDSRYLLPSSR